MTYQERQQKIKDSLKGILGEACVNGSDFSPSNRERAMANAINYLGMQMGILANLEEKSERNDYLIRLVDNLCEILDSRN